MTTTNLSDFGYRELTMLQELLKAMQEQGLPANFNDDEVVPMMNQSSGNVFLTNSDYQVAMLDGEELKQFYFLSYYGLEGFADELYNEFKNDNVKFEDLEELADILENEGMTEEAEEVKAKFEELEAVEG